MAIWDALPLPRGAGFRLLDDPTRLELVGPELLRAESAAAGLAAARARGEARAAALLDHARLLREHGQRAGAPESLSKAARQAEAAGGPAGALEGALCALAAAELAGDGALLEAAAARLAEPASVARTDLTLTARTTAARAALAVRTALDAGEAASALTAAAACDAAVEALARAARRTPALLPDLARARCDRAELLTGFALRLRDTASAARAAADMADLLPGLDEARTPVLRARAMRLHGEALTAEGELSGCPRRLAEAVQVLRETLDVLAPGHAPVERARAGRALGHAARALAEASEPAPAADILMRAAVSAFEAARESLEGAGVPALAAQLAFERAAALAARALRAQDDAPALRAAVDALRGELRRLDARRDPAAWAAVQVALARLYAADPLGGRRAEAALALEAALEVFGEAGLATLADEAAQALRDLRSA